MGCEVCGSFAVKNIDNSGNTGLVGWTCFTYRDATTEEKETLRSLRVRLTGSYYADVRIGDWPAVFSYLTLLGHKLEFVSDYAQDDTAKWREWVKVLPYINLTREG